jgi:hypothetical protein
VSIQPKFCAPDGTGECSCRKFGADPAGCANLKGLDMKPEDPTARSYMPLPYTGWTVQTPDEMFTVLSQLMDHLAKRRDGDGQQLLARLWRVNSPLLARIDSLQWVTHTCIGKGGQYQHLGLAHPAGELRGSAAVEVYRDVATGQLYFRTPDDFSRRMALISYLAKPDLQSWWNDYQEERRRAAAMAPLETRVERDWRHDVADNGQGLHIIMRGKRYSLCTQVDMEKRGGLQFVGAWDDGLPPTCDNCLRVWAAMRREAGEPNNYFEPVKD